MTWLIRIAVVLAVVSCLVVLAGGPAYQAGLVDLELAMLQGFRLAALTGLAAVALGLVGLASRLFARRGPWFSAAAAVLLGAAGAAVPIGMRIQVDQVPMIHDITTDVVDPPAFEAVLAARADAPNPPGYDPAVAPLQQQAYPDLKPIRVAESEEQVFAQCLRVVEALGWELVDADAVARRIEATDTTPWFGFQDDIVIRVRGIGGATVVDARSKSRVGRSDLGKNAERLRAFRHQLLRGLTKG